MDVTGRLGASALLRALMESEREAGAKMTCPTVPGGGFEEQASVRRTGQTAPHVLS